MPENIADTLASLVVPISNIKPRPRNPRKGDIELIKESLEVNGQYRPIVVNKTTGQVLAGNHTFKAAKELRWKNIAATYVEATEEQAAKIVLVDNRAPDKAYYDTKELVEILKELETDLKGTGYEQHDLDALVASMMPELNQADEWVGMPEFEQDDKTPTYRVSISFQNHEDADEFFKLINRPKKVSMWWPQSDGLIGSDVSEEFVIDDETYPT